MPFNLNMKAKASADGNCGLNSMVHTLPQLIEGGHHPQELEKLAGFFKAHYNIATPFARADLQRIIQETPNPIEREALLTPVLRAMMCKSIQDSTYAGKPNAERLAKISKAKEPLFAHELLYLANDLGLNLEAYEGDDTNDSLAARKIPPFQPKNYARVHKIRNSGDNHWEFEMNCNKVASENKRMLDEHNAHFNNRIRAFNEQVLRNRVKTEVEAGHRKLSRIFAEPEVIAKTNKAAPQGKFGQIASMVDNFVNSMINEANNNGKSNDVFTTLFKAIANILKAILGFTELANQIGNVNSQEMNSKEMDDLPEGSRTETAEFMEYTKQLAAAGGSAQLAARELNKAWIKNVNQGGRESDALWLKLIDTLKRHDKLEEAFELLKQREEAFVNDLDKEAEKPAANANAVPNPNVDNKHNADVKQAREAEQRRQKISKGVRDKLKGVLNDLNSLTNNAEIAQGSRSVQALNFNTRLNLFKKVIKSDEGTMRPILTQFERDYSDFIKGCKDSRERAAAGAAAGNR